MAKGPVYRVLNPQKEPDLVQGETGAHLKEKNRCADTGAALLIKVLERNWLWPGRSRALRPLEETTAEDMPVPCLEPPP